MRPPEVDLPAQVPIYQRIARILRSRIFHGIYKEGEAIPSENELSREFGVTRLTVRQAIAELRAEEILESRRGSGTFVATEKPVVRPVTFVGYLEDLILQGLTLKTRIGAVASAEPPQYIRKALVLRASQRAMRIERIRYVDTVPTLFIVNFIQSDIARRVHPPDLKDTSLIDLLSRQAGVTTTHAMQTITAVAATTEVARHLQMKRGDPIVYCDLLIYSGDRPINYSQMYYRPDKVQFSAVLTSLPTLTHALPSQTGTGSDQRSGHPAERRAHRPPVRAT